MVETLASFCDDMGWSPQDLSQDTVPACINETLGMSTEGSVLLWLLKGQPDEGGKVLRGERASPMSASVSIIVHFLFHLILHY